MNDVTHDHEVDSGRDENDVATLLRDAATTFRPAPGLADSIREALSEERPSRLRFPRWRVAGAASITLVAAALIAAVMLWPVSISLAEMKAAVERAPWIHVKYDDGRESWHSTQHGVSAHIVGDRSQFSFFKGGRKWSWTDYTSPDGTVHEPAAQIFEDVSGGIANPRASATPTAWSLYVAPAEQAAERGPRGDFDYERHDETVDGRRLVRFDTYFTDAIGQRLLLHQIWADPGTRLPVAVSRRLQLHERKRVGREFARGTFAFPDEGPMSIYDLGVSRDIPIVERDRSGPDEGVRWLLEGAEESRLRFPERYRVLTWSDQGLFRIDFDGRPALATLSSDHTTLDYADVGIRMENYFGFRRAFGRAAAEVPYELVREWVAAQQPVELYVSDGTRTFVQRGPWPKDHRGPAVTARVNRMKFNTLFPTNAWPTDYQWPRQINPRAEAPLERIDDVPDAPPGTVGIRRTRGDQRSDYFIDPDRDFICLKHVVWKRHTDPTRGETWRRRSESTLDGLVQLGSGHWIATRRTEYQAGDLDQDPPITDSETHWTIDVRDAGFPEDHFDIEAMIEAAKTLGATIESY